MTAKLSLLLALAAFLLGCATTGRTPGGASPQQQVFEAERAFAATMASRDFDAFARFVDEEAIFFTGPEPLRGKEAVLTWWSRYFEKANAPFSWQPDQVEVLASGTLALSTGVVYGPDGAPFARFNSVWRLTQPGVWRVVFDKGSPLEPPG